MSEYRIKLFDKINQIYSPQQITSAVSAAFGLSGFLGAQVLSPADTNSRESKYQDITRYEGSGVLDLLSIKNPRLESLIGSRSFSFNDLPVYISFSSKVYNQTTVINSEIPPNDPSLGYAEGGEILENATIGGNRFQKWDIKVNGLLVNEDHNGLSLEKIGLFRRATQVSDSYEVVSELLNELDIFKVIVTGLRINPLVDYPDTVEFELGLNSFEPVESLIL